MRVVAGRFGGRTLVAPRGRSTRPTSDRVREALFSILGPDLVDGARVLDLFAGSGAMAIEALSRGAADATLVDSSAASVAAIRRNLSSLGVQAEVRRQDALAYLRGASRDARQYDLVFLDPPYRHAGALGIELSAALGPVGQQDIAGCRQPLAQRLALGGRYARPRVRRHWVRSADRGALPARRP